MHIHIHTHIPLPQALKTLLSLESSVTKYCPVQNLFHQNLFVLLSRALN